MTYLDELPDLEEVEECPDESDYEARHDDEEKEVVLPQPPGGHLKSISKQKHDMRRSSQARGEGARP